MAYIENKYIATNDPNVFENYLGEEFTRTQLEGFLETLAAKDMKSLFATEKKYLVDLDTLVGSGYKEARRIAYPSIQEQLDMQFHDAANGTTTWNDAIQAVKDAHPKPE